jgi:hypothetical protein
VNQSTTAVVRYAARTATSTVYATASSSALTATPGLCHPALTGTKDQAATYYADPVVVTGTLTRTVGAATVPVAGTSLPVRLTSGTATAIKVVTLGTAVTAADGSYRIVVRPTASGTMSVELPGSAAYVATRVDLGTVQVSIPQTRMDAAVSATDVGYGTPVTVTGSLQRDAGGTLSPLTGASVTIKVTKSSSSTATSIGTAKVGTDGAFSASVPLKVSGALVAVYAGTAGQPAASVALGPVVAGTWTPTVTATPSATHVSAGAAVTMTGSVTRTYAGSTGPAPSVKVSAYFTPSGSTTRTLLGSATTGTGGGYTLRLLPKGTGTWTMRVTGVAGYAEASADDVVVTVG